MKKLLVLLLITSAGANAQIETCSKYSTFRNTHVVPWYLALKYADRGIECPWLYDYSAQFFSSLERKDSIDPSLIHKTFVLIKNKDAYGPVLVNQEGVIVQGIEFLAAALLYDKQIEVQEIDQELPPATFDLAKNNGLNPEILDWFVLEYMRLNPKCYNAVLWPKGRRHGPYIKKRFNTIGDVIFEKTFELKNYGHYLFVQQIAGKSPKLNWFLKIYFRTKFNPAKLTLFVIETNRHPREVRKFKQGLRREVRYDFAIHGDDNNRQAVQTCQMILHKATNDFINTIPLLPAKIQHSLTATYFEKLANGQREDYCITNFHHIPTDKKINYITTRQSIDFADCKNDQYIKNEIDAFIYNPTLYHYFRHAKCTKTVNELVEEKRNLLNLNLPENTLCRFLEELDEE